MRPVDRMTQFARSVGVRDLGRRLDYHGPDDELGRLAQTLDDMLTRLQASFERERRFVADAAHELRTPLTAIKGRIDVLHQRSRDAEAYRTAIDSIEPEVERLIRLVRDLLLLARLETDTTAWEQKPVDLSQLCEHIVEQMRILAEERGLSITLAVPPGLVINGSFDHLLRALINLLDNAIKYSDSPGTVAIQGCAVGDMVRIQVCNNGNPLDPRLVKHVGDRFLRTDKGRSSGMGGAGLGLAITSEIARRHGGSFALVARAEGGAEATLTVPSAAMSVSPRKHSPAVRA
jgi:signal transduction histidine kinase